MTKVKQGDNVKVHYTGKLSNGNVFDSSQGREPLTFTIGQGMMIPGFEKGLLNMAVGEEKTIVLPPSEAYGDVREDMLAEIEKNQLPPEIKPEVGMELVSQQPNGQQMVVKIKEVKEKSIIIDANHQLAGKELTFEIKLVEIA